MESEEVEKKIVIERFTEKEMLYKAANQELTYQQKLEFFSSYIAKHILEGCQPEKCFESYKKKIVEHLEMYEKYGKPVNGYAIPIFK